MSKYKVKKYNEIESTNTFALTHIDELQDQDVILAKRQISGRGRFNREWISDDSDNLYMTIVLKPFKIDAFPFQNMTQYLALKLCEVLEGYGVEASLKWPNDVLVKGAKISGILAEGSSHKGKITAIVLGIGVNLNFKYETLTRISQKATSLNMILGKKIDVEDFSKKLLDKFFDDYETFINKGFPLIMESYESKCSFLGQKIKVSSLSEDEFYLAKKINIDGTLTVLDKNNIEIPLTTGDLTY